MLHDAFNKESKIENENKVADIKKNNKHINMLT